MICMQQQEKLVLSYCVAGQLLDHGGSDLVNKLTDLQIFNVIASKVVSNFGITSEVRPIGRNLITQWIVLQC